MIDVNIGKPGYFRYVLGSRNQNEERKTPDDPRVIEELVQHAVSRLVEGLSSKGIR